MDNKKHQKLLSFIFIILTGHCTFQVDTKNEDNKVKEPKSEINIGDVLFIVLSQPNSYHKTRAEIFKQHFEDQLTEIDKEKQPRLILAHEEWDFPGVWTVFPLLPELSSKFSDKAWVFICEDETRINLQKLEKLLQKYDHSKELFLGHALRDPSPTIIHHFAFFDGKVKFDYPDFGAGFLLSNPLFNRLGKAWPVEGFRADFSIDPKHEVAMLIWDDGKGITLTDVAELCTDNFKDICASWYPMKFPDCGGQIKEEDLFVGVKTCEKFHKERLQIIRNTWGKTTKHIEYYSDKEDPSIPTISLGIPNTERGHCGKTMAMIKRFYNHKDLSKYHWYLIADDDTLINLQRLRKLLACYDPKEVIHLGEKYGYSVAKKNWGYNYITGGGGMIFSREAIRLLVDKGMIECGQVDSPDDMTLGMRFKHLGVPLVHSPYFHQARPDDYSPKFLNARTALSFHKFWNNDPYKVYERLTEKENMSHDSSTDKSHDEL